MFAFDQDSDAHPLRRLVPALRRDQRLSADLMNAESTDAATKACTPELLTYLSTECSNETQVCAVQQQLDRYRDTGKPLESVKAAATAVDTRASTLVAATKARVAQYDAQSSDLLAKLSATASGGTSSAVQERHFIGVSTAALGALTAGRYTGRDQSNPCLSCVWRLTPEDPAAAENCLLQAPVTPTATLPETSRTAPLSYEMHALSSAVSIAAPYLVKLQYVALVTGNASEAIEIATSAAIELSSNLGRTGGRRAFATLEVLRHCTIIALSGNPVKLNALLSRLASEFHEALEYVTELDGDIKEARKMQQLPAALSCLRDAAAFVLREYALFFHVCMSVVDAAANATFDELSKSLDPRNVALCGLYRFPFLAPLLVANTNGRAQRRQARDPTSGATTSVVVCAGDVTGNAVHKDAVTGTLIPFTPALTALVVNTLMPAASFATFVLLSCLATRPMAEVLTLFAGTTELQMLAESSPHLLSLLRALQRGDWGGVYTAARDAAADHLGNEPLLAPSTGRALMSEVRLAVCYQYLRVRAVVSIEQAAVALKLPGGARELTLVAERLIQDNRLPARINGVTGVIRQFAPPTDPKRVLVEALTASEASAHETELQLRLLSASRCFGTPSQKSTDIEFWEAGPTRAL